MKANLISLVGNVIFLGEKRTVKGTNGRDDFDSVYLRLSVPRPFKAKKGESYETVVDIHDAQIMGQQATFMDDYGRNFYADGEKKGKFIARQIYAQGYFEVYQGKVKSEKMDLDIDGVGVVELPEGYVEMTTPKVRFHIVSFDFLDYVETDKPKVKVKDSDDKPAKLQVKVKTNEDKGLVDDEEIDAEDVLGGDDDVAIDSADKDSEVDVPDSKSDESEDTEEELGDFNLDDTI